MRYQASETPVMVARFSTGETVDITLYDLSNGLSEALDDDSCTEIGATGYFYWSFSDITAMPGSFTEFLWIMEDSHGLQQAGKVVISGYVDDIDQSLVDMEDNIRGADDDDLKDISDEIAALNDITVADVWGEALPGAYGAGTGGELIGNNLDAAVSDVEQDTQNIQSRLPAALVGGAMDSDVSNLQAAALAQVTGDVWSEAVPGAYGAGEAGKLLGDNLDQAISTTETNIRGADNDDLKDISDQIDSLPSASDVWSEALPGAYGLGTAGNIVGNNLDASVADVETDTQNIQSRLPAALVGGAMDSDVSNLQAAALAQINTEVDTGLTDIGLDHLLAAAVVGGDITDNSVIARMASKQTPADWDSFVNTTDSLEAISDATASAADESVQYSGLRYALAKFQTGDTVTIAVYDAKTGAAVGLQDSSCQEMGTTGYFYWSTQYMSPDDDGTYLWIMDNTVYTKAGEFNFGDYEPEGISTPSSTRTYRFKA